MGIDIDTFAGGLFEQFLKILEVMTAHEYARMVSDTNVDPGDFGVAVGRCVCLVKQRHSLYTALAHIKDKREQFVHIYVRTAYLGKGVLDDDIYIFVLITEVTGVTGIGRHTLAAVHGKLFETSYVRVLVVENTCDFFFKSTSVFDYLIYAIFLLWNMIRHLRHERRLHAAFFRLSFEFVFQFEGFCDIAVEHIIVEIRVGDGGEQCVDDKPGCTLA